MNKPLTVSEIDARIEEAVLYGIQAFWDKVVEIFPESEGGDFDPMYEGAMYSEASDWIRHWLMLNSRLLDDRK